jgi:tripartite-type tricarboxylate transporter receptor subunit TctC
MTCAYASDSLNFREIARFVQDLRSYLPHIRPQLQEASWKPSIAKFRGVMMITKRTFSLGLCATSLASMVPGAWQAAQSQPGARGARIIVGFGPGGALDVVARLLTTAMKGYASPFIVENRPGASERIALEAVKSSAADGSTLLLTGSSSMAIVPHVYKKLNYDPLQDFIPVTTVCSFPFTLTVGPMVPAEVKTLADFVSWSRANPKQATYGTVGAGSLHHLIGATLARAAGFEFVHVPYQGLAAIQDLLAGRIAATVFPSGTSLPYVRSGELRALMTTGTRRSSSLPDVPTVRELGYPAIEEDDWFGIFVPARMPVESVNTLNSTIRAALKTDDVKAGFAKLSLDPSGDSPEGFARLVKSEFDRWGPIVEASGFRAEN